MSDHMVGKMPAVTRSCFGFFFLFVFSQLSVVHASASEKEKWSQERPRLSDTWRTGRLCSHSRGSWIPGPSLGYYQCFLRHFLCLDTNLFWKEILIPQSHESDMVVMFTVNKNCVLPKSCAPLNHLERIACGVCSFWTGQNAFIVD